jgi:acetyl-CoA carboxylase biotin carboxylase subunit
MNNSGLMTSPLLIANRGEIAVRIIFAAHGLHGTRSVAVYSEADVDAPHVQIADEAILIGPAEAAQSYLNTERILAAANQSGAKAIHPGYGFLAENADFAQAVIDAGLIWVGPPPAAIRTMGDKAAARSLMQEAGVPILPGYQGPDDDASLKKAAKDIGYPLLVKAAAGGGGVGMQVVHKAADLHDAIQAARRSAKNAFGDARLLLEKYLPRAHHVEIQVLGDQHGNLLHLFERECSIQRRHQKIIEETPSPLMDADLCGQMTEAALAAAAAVNYTNAGTIEFLVDPQTRDFYFLEMNTRLQVEHRITEMVTDLDIVQWQLRIAAGEHLPFTQEDIQQQGHSIECRIYAEDPSADFLPQTGRIHKLLLDLGEGIYIDSGVDEGQEITSFYDPMLAKIIVHADDRAAAIERMQAALDETAFLGVTTNLNFLQALLAHTDFVAAKADTNFVERELAGWQPEAALPPEVLIAAALLDSSATPIDSDAELDPSDDLHSPWARVDAFRIGGQS